MKKHLNINNFLKNNSPTILTIVGSIGVGLTAIVSAKDTAKALKRIEEERWSYEDGQHYYSNKLSFKQKAKIAISCYIPTILTGISTILCICGANKLNKNVQKSLTSAYILLDQSLKEYKGAVRDTYGEDGELAVIKNIADKHNEVSNQVEPDDMFLDFYSLQFFHSDLAVVQEAEKTINDMLQTNGYVSLKTVHALIGEETVGTDSLLGWSIGAGRIYDYDSIRFDIREISREDGSKYYVLDFMDAPSDDYMYYI